MGRFDDCVVIKMSLEDIEEVALVEAASFSQPWTAKAFYEMLDEHRANYLVLKSQGHVIGVAGLLYSFDEAEVSNVAILPEYRGRGFSNLIMRKLLEMGESRGVVAFSLEVRMGNVAAIHLYESFGFVIEATRKNCYALPTEDGYIMWKR